MMNSKKFLHSGDMGDIIYSLPTIKYLGGGTLFLNPAVEKNDFNYKLTTKLSRRSIDSIKPLLMEQSYIEDVEIWRGEEIDFNLDLFRGHIKYNNLAKSHLSAFNLPLNHAEIPWLTHKDRIQLPKPYIISRSVRYHSNYVEWVRILNTIKDSSIFIGLEKEHEIFEYTYEIKIPFYPTPTVWDMTTAIVSSERIFCNQSLPHAIAEALGHPLHCEVFRPYPAAIFPNKPTSQYF